MTDPASHRDDSNLPGKPAMSILAVVAVVLAFIPCPPVSMAGALLGLMAWRRIRDSAGRLAGHRLCVIAMIAGVLLSIVTLWSAQRFADWQQSEQEQDMAVVLDGFLRSASGGEVQRSLMLWSQGDEALTEMQVEQFTAALQDHFGEFESVRIGSSEPVPGPSLLALRMECWIIGRFDSGQRNGSARFAMLPTPGKLTLRPVLVEISFEVKDGEPIVLPHADTTDPGEEE